MPDRWDTLRVFALTVTVTIVFCAIHDRWNRWQWNVPLGSTSDALSLLSAIKSVTEGDFLPIIEKFNPHLGAPYIANWNDWPVTEEPMIEFGGALAKIIGLFPAANLLVLLAQILAVNAFYLVARILRYRWQWAALGALAFALSHYAFQRGLPHLALTYYWHIPLCLLVAWRCGSVSGVQIGRNRRFYASLAIAFLTGVQNPYYTNLFLQFVGFATLAQLLRRATWRKVAGPMITGACTTFAFLLMNADTIVFQLQHGKNAEAAGRNYRSLEVYALKPVDLLVPPPDHRSAAARKLAWNYLYDEQRKAFLIGEPFSPYLGMVGLAGLGWMSLLSLGRILSVRRSRIPVEAVQTVWVVLYSSVGGINGLLGLGGLLLFRCTNRYSIYILALSLLFLAKALTKLTRRWPPLAVTSLAGALALLVCWDQLPPTETNEALAVMERALRSDQAFVRSVEALVRPGAMIFQLPVMRFPESWPIQQMGDYEHLRPYLYSTKLHFSYGADKGRPQDEWQSAVERLPAPAMAASLEKFGFSAIYINRKGYVDHGAALVSGLRAAGFNSVIDSPGNDLTCVLLQASPSPVPPDLPVRFGAGWYGEEGNPAVETWHCSSGDATVILTNSSSAPRDYNVSFRLASPSPRTVEIRLGETLLYQSPALTAQKINDWFTVQLPPGESQLRFHTQPAVTFPGNADTRVLGFVLYDFNVVEQR